MTTKQKEHVVMDTPAILHKTKTSIAADALRSDKYAGHSLRFIARELGLAPETVSRAYRRLGFQTTQRIGLDGKRRRHSGTKRRSIVPRSKLNGNTHVYFIQHGNDGPVKIGTSKDVRARFSDIQVDNWSELFLRAVIWNGGPEKERELHQRFSGERIRGEWFRPCLDIIRLMSTYKLTQEKMPEPVQLTPL